MKKSGVVLSVAFVLALGSAFTTKTLNIIGYAGNFSGPTNHRDCQVTIIGTDCTIFSSDLGIVSPVYSDELGSLQFDETKRIKIPN